MSGPAFRRVAVAARAAELRNRRTACSLRTYRVPSGFEALIPEDVIQRLHSFAGAAAPNEFAALIAVRRFHDDAGAYVIVDGVVPFLDAKGDASNVATSVEDERRAREMLRLVFPGSEPGGWAHTHPGWGLFMSKTDRVTQRTWTEPTSLGIVVDHTIAHRIFIVHGPDAVEMELVHVSEVANGIASAPTPVGMTKSASTAVPRKRRRARLAARLLGTLLAITIATYGILVSVRRVGARLDRIERRIANVEAAASTLRDATVSAPPTPSMPRPNAANDEAASP